QRVGRRRVWRGIRRISLAKDRIEIEEDAGLAGGRVHAIDDARPVGCPRVAPGASRDGIDVVSEDAAGSCRDIHNIAANEESGVNGKTEVIGAAVLSRVAAVFCVTVTTPRLSLVGVAAGVNVAWSGKSATAGASSWRCSNGAGRSMWRSRRRRCAGPRA